MSETPTSSPERVVSPTNAISLRRTPVRKATRADGPYVQAIRKKIEGEESRRDRMRALLTMKESDDKDFPEGHEKRLEDTAEQSTADNETITGAIDKEVVSSLSKIFSGDANVMGGRYGSSQSSSTPSHSPGHAASY